METGNAGRFEEAFRQHGRYLWQVLYRLTGCAADAEDLVQETFVRALEKPPADLARSLRPWLVRVAMNLGRDSLRRRRRTKYVGPWLPSPVASSEEDAPASFELSDADGLTTEGRYDLLESVSYAFLLALEALTPKQRAVLLLRDVFDYSVRDTAWALDLSEGNVKTTHHRARAAMRGYEERRAPRAGGLQSGTRAAVERLVLLLREGDVRGLEALLSEDVRMISDGGGEFLAALNPILGRDHVVRFLAGVRPGEEASYDVSVRSINGLPALDVRFDDPGPRQSPRLVLSVDVDADGRVVSLYAVLASRKLASCV